MQNNVFIWIVFPLKMGAYSFLELVAKIAFHESQLPQTQ